MVSRFCSYCSLKDARADGDWASLRRTPRVPRLGGARFAMRASASNLRGGVRQANEAANHAFVEIIRKIT